MKVYGRANSINVRKALWMLDEVGERFTREDWGRGYRATSEPEFMAVSRFGVVPVIEDDGFILRESHAIVRYLANKHNRTDLYPTDLRKRATVDAWMEWGATDLYQGVRPVFMGLIVKNPVFTDAKIIAAGADEWNQQMARLDAELAGGGPYIMGKDFTIADIPIGVVVNRWFSIDFKKPDLPAVAAYYDQLNTRKPYRTHVRNGTP